MRLQAPLLAAVPALLLAAAAGAAEPFEQPPAWRAALVLPPAVASGPNHRVEDPVHNDGVMNIYRVSSRFGALEAHSRAELEKRVHELDAIERLQRLEGTEEFGKAIVGAGGNVVEGAKALATDPVNTVTGVVSGVGAMFHRAGNSLTGAPRSDYEDGALGGITGFSAKKREFAAEFGVDVYSSNPLLQEALDRVARAAAVGNLSASAALALVGGGAGAAISITEGSQSLYKMLRETPPTDLRELNQSRLAEMGVNEHVVELFMSNTVFSPTYQTLLVDALARMDGVSDRQVFVKGAVRTETDDLAMYRQRQARMYAAFHLQVAPLERFVPLGTITAARTRDGRLVLLLPVDYVAWTQSGARTTERITAEARAAVGEAPRELWLGGGVTPTAKAALESAGWTLHLDNAAKLVGPG